MKPNIKITPMEVTPPEPRKWVVEVDFSRASFAMLAKQVSFELFKPFIMAYLFILSYLTKKKVGIFKITNTNKYDSKQ